ncbi:MAG TPA: hypothetical protein VMG59_03220 [Phycisphaerae bacterium]|nr:hypothetical protein [Phycisphaerae bacterium]
MRAIETEHHLRIIDFPFYTALFTLFLAIIFGYGFVTHLLSHAPLSICAIILLGLVITVIVGGILVQRSEFEFDAQEKKVTWNRRSIFRSQGGVIPFEQIAFAVVQAGFINSDGTNITGYRVALLTRNGRIPLTPRFSGSDVRIGRRGIHERCRDIRSRINRILDIHLTSEDANDILQMIRDGQRREAEAMAKERYQLKSAQAAEMVQRLSQEVKE